MATAYPTIRQGSTGATVSFLQKNLITLGYGWTLQPNGADGIFGAKTTQAVRDFQTKHGLGVDGVVGQRTWDKILSLVPSTDVLVNTIQATIAQPPKKAQPQTAIAPPPPPRISLPPARLPESINVSEPKKDSRIPADDNTSLVLVSAVIAGFYFFVLPKKKRK
jgi:peptidoglycan hydrolase-like protein with peptidoglycan-binding domain